MNIKTKILNLITLILLFFSAANLSAVTFEKGESVHISNLHQIEDDLFIWSENITVDGLIYGDLIAGGFKVKTNGHIKYSANIFSYNFNHNGKISGSLRFAGYTSSVDGYVGRSAVLFGSDITLGKKGVIANDLVVVGESIELNGTVEGNTKASGTKIYLSGTFEGDVNLQGENIKILPPALIKGDLSYISENQAMIDLASGVTIIGNTTWDLPESAFEDETSTTFSTVITLLSKLLAAFLFGVILLMISRKYLSEAYYQLKDRVAVSLATGFLTFIIGIFCLVILFASLVLLIVGSILISGEQAFLGALLFVLSTLLIPLTSFGAVSGGLLFYSGKIIVAFLFGALLIKSIKPSTSFLSRTQLFTGLFVITLVFAIPYLGILLYLFSSIIGAGAIVLGIKNCRHDQSATDESAAKKQLGA